MKVKIRKNIYDCKIEPIMLILTEKDKKNISEMHPNATVYCAYPDDMNRDELMEFVNRA